MQKKKHKGLSSFLNAHSQQASRKENTHDIVNIPIEEIAVNPKNFYGLRDIDELAHSIELTKIVTPLTVIEKENRTEGEPKYLLIAGHRRRAAWQKLLDDGKVENHNLPCLIRVFEPVVIHTDDGERTITPERLADAFLMLDNMGQRRRTVDERLQEVMELEPFARDLYDGQPVGKRGNFRTFFATDIIGISESNLQRLLSLKKLTAKGKAYVDDSRITFTFASKLSALPADMQDEYLASIDNGERTGTVDELTRFKQGLKNDKENMETQEPADTVEPVHDEPAGFEEPEEPEKEPLEEPDEPDEDSFDSQSRSHFPDGTEIQSGETPEEPQETPAPKKTSRTSNGIVELAVSGLPSNLTSKEFDPKSEASRWAKEEQLKILENLMTYCQEEIESYTDDDDLKSAQWNMRYAELQVRALMLRKELEEK